MTEPSVLDAWVTRARRGDARAFDTLVVHFQSGLYHLVVQHLRDHDEALDVCQESVLSAWQAIPRFSGDAEAFRRWLYRIAINATRDRQRYEARRPHASLDVEADGASRALPLPAPGRTPEEYAENADLRALLEQCLERLTQEHRLVVLLDQLGLGYAEIAEVLGTEVGTVKSRLSRARARMRELLTGTGDDRFAEPNDMLQRSDGSGPGSSRRRAPEADNMPAPGRSL